jgi:acyl-CoA synthetase (AMP-forming)/AMP-acid ligase II
MQLETCDSGVAKPPVRGTVHGAFMRTAARHPDKDFLHVLEETARIYGIDGRRYSYQETAAGVASLAECYREAGFGHGHRVGLMLENRPAMFFHWLALNSLGVSAVPLNSDWRRAELEYVMAHSEMCAAVVPEDRAPEVAGAANSAGREVVVTSASLQGLQRISVSGPAAGEQVDENSECALLYTSGTTGRPKGCVLTNEYYLWAGTWYAQAGELCRLDAGTERLLTPLPMTHMNAMAFSTMAMVLSGGCIIPLDRFHPSSWWASVRESRATIVHYLGVMPAMLLLSPPQSRDREHRVKFGFGAGVSPRLHAEFESRFGFPLLEAWAMTETGAGGVVMANREPRKVGTACFGRPGTRVEYRVIAQHGGDASPGEHGELLVRSAGGRANFGFFREYLRDPQSTAEAWSHGYFRTGDIVFADEDGDLHFVDRKKNVIRRSGENISAVEVEGVILQHPSIGAVGVAGVPDDIRGDEVMACVVPRDPLSETGRQALAHELMDFCMQRLAYFKAPGFVAFCTALPLTPTEKIQRAKLAELARELLGSDSTVDLRARKKRTAVG